MASLTIRWEFPKFQRNFWGITFAATALILIGCVKCAPIDLLSPKTTDISPASSTTISDLERTTAIPKTTATYPAPDPTGITTIENNTERTTITADQQQTTTSHHDDDDEKFTPKQYKFNDATTGFDGNSSTTLATPTTKQQSSTPTMTVVASGMTINSTETSVTPLNDTFTTAAADGTAVTTDLDELKSLSTSVLPPSASEPYFIGGDLSHLAFDNGEPTANDTKPNEELDAIAKYSTQITTEKILSTDFTITNKTYLKLLEDQRDLNKLVTMRELTENQYTTQSSDDNNRDEADPPLSTELPSPPTANTNVTEQSKETPPTTQLSIAERKYDLLKRKPIKVSDDEKIMEKMKSGIGNVASINGYNNNNSNKKYMPVSKEGKNKNVGRDGVKNLTKKKNNKSQLQVVYNNYDDEGVVDISGAATILPTESPLYTRTPEHIYRSSSVPSVMRSNTIEMSATTILATSATEFTTSSRQSTSSSDSFSATESVVVNLSTGSPDGVVTTNPNHGILSTTQFQTTPASSSGWTKEASQREQVGNFDVNQEHKIYAVSDEKKTIDHAIESAEGRYANQAAAQKITESDEYKRGYANINANINMKKQNVNNVVTTKSIDTESDELFVLEAFDEKRTDDEVKSFREGVETPNHFHDNSGNNEEHISIKSSDDKLPSVDRDSDTIFYISNTEVKVVESMPTQNPRSPHNADSQFYPSIYEEDVFIDFSNKNHSRGIHNNGAAPDKYEEDIILSPMKNNFDPMKINDEELSISYVGESFIEVEELTSDSSAAIVDAPSSASATLDNGNTKMQSANRNTKDNNRNGNNGGGVRSDVIIQPVAMPEVPQLSIGVPVIGELPPQIELTQIGYGDHFNEEAVTLRADNLKKTQLSADIPTEIAADTIYASTVKRFVNGTAGDAAATTNVTAHPIVDDETEFDFTDISTLVQASSLTLILLVIIVLSGCGIRCAWRKYNSQGTGSSLVGDNSTDPLAAKSCTGSADELKSTESEFTINRSNDTLESSTEMMSKFDGTHKSNHTGANGSVITMTMKNNHLIVETEERNDISRDARETKMHYSPSEKDGVFVVKVARGANTTTTPTQCNEQSDGGAQKSCNELVPQEPTKHNDVATAMGRNHVDPVAATPKGSKEKVQVHKPPDSVGDEEHLIAVGDDGVITMNSPQLNGHDPICGSTNTGLSQSDLSLSSSAGSNKAYSYGKQESYIIDTPGYRAPSPVQLTLIDIPKVNCNDKPVITAAVFKEESVAATHSNIDGTAQWLSSDDNALLPNTKPDEVMQEEQRQLGNGEISAEKALADNGNGCDGVQENGDGFDSLINLPEPPTTDEIKQLNDFSSLDANNLDSLPPPPPPEVIVADEQNGNSS